MSAMFTGTTSRRPSSSLLWRNNAHCMLLGLLKQEQHKSCLTMGDGLGHPQAAAGVSNQCAMHLQPRRGALCHPLHHPWCHRIVVAKSKNPYPWGRQISIFPCKVLQKETWPPYNFFQCAHGKKSRPLYDLVSKQGPHFSQPFCFCFCFLLAEILWGFWEVFPPRKGSLSALILQVKWEMHKHESLVAPTTEYSA